MIATPLLASVYFERSNVGRIVYGRHSPDSLQARQQLEQKSYQRRTRWTFNDTLYDGFAIIHRERAMIQRASQVQPLRRRHSPHHVS